MEAPNVFSMCLNIVFDTFPIVDELYQVFKVILGQSYQIFGLPVKLPIVVAAHV